MSNTIFHASWARQKHLRGTLSLPILASILFTAGCGSVRSSSVAGPVQTTALGNVAGSVHGGQQPVANAHIYVYAVGAGSVGTASTSLLLPGAGTTADAKGQYYVLADAGGNFTVTGEYACTAGTQVYVYASGGNAGAGNNPAIGLMAGLGQCPATGTLALQVPFVIVNEVSTVVMAYALAGFAEDATHIYSSGSTLGRTGVGNAMMNVVNIYPPASGQTPAQTANGAGTTPVSQIDMLANILAACVNMGTPNGSGGACATLFADATSDSTPTGVVPTDTATAAINIAHYPFSNLSSLYALQTPAAPFQPSPATVPTDFTVAVFYKTAASLPDYVGGANGGTSDALAVDAAGSLWVRSANGQNVTGFLKYGPTASVLATAQIAGNSTTGGNADDGGSRIDIDAAGNLWSPGFLGEYEISSQGIVLSPPNGFYCQGMELLQSTVFSPNGNAYIGDLSAGSDPNAPPQSSIWELNLATKQCSGSLSVHDLLTGELTLGIDGSVFTSGGAGSGSLIYDFAQGTGSFSSFPAYAGDLRFDAAGDLWSDYGSVLKYTTTGQEISPTDGYLGGGILPPANETYFHSGSNGPIIDGAGAAWVARTPCPNTGNFCTSDIIVGLRNDGTPITPSTGLAVATYVPGFSSNFAGVVVDGSGNLWGVLSQGALVQYLGLTTPVATPILYNNAGTRP